MKKKMIITIILSIILLNLCGWVNTSSPTAQNGVLNLEDWDFNKDGKIPLAGEWGFYWESFVPTDRTGSKHTIMEVSSGWDKDTDFPSTGYGLYQLQIKGLQIGKTYGIKIPVMSNSYRLWIDEQLLITNGNPGRTKSTTDPYYRTQEVFFTAKSSSIHIYMGISNFHYRTGGMWSKLELGTTDQITSLTKKNLAFEMMLFGSLILSGLYHIVLYLYKRKDKIILLFFGIICLLIGTRTIVIGERFIVDIFPQIPWELIIKLEYLTFYLVVPFFTWFMYFLYKEEISRYFNLTLSIISLLLSLIVILTPAIVYTETLFFFQTITVITLFYMIFALIKAVVRKREGATVVLLCSAFYAATIINDILYINGRLDTANLSSLGLFVFVFSQSYIIAKSVSNAFQKVEEYSLELVAMNSNLEEKIYERTKSLEMSKFELQKANQALTEMSYQDPLTQLPNRRYFEELYEQEWEEAANNQSLLSIIYFDIDHFKSYNDAYGHENGDVTLRKVATCLQGTIQTYNGTVARIGGEEFISVISHKNSEELQLIVEECRHNVESLQILHEQSFTSQFVTVSIGAATTIPDPHSSKRKLIRTADEALYQAKEAGRNQVVVTSIMLQEV